MSDQSGNAATTLRPGRNTANLVSGRKVLFPWFWALAFVKGGDLNA